MKESSRMPLFDLRKLNASLPVPSLPKSCIEVLVLGASDDFIVVNFNVQYIHLFNSFQVSSSSMSWFIPIWPLPSNDFVFSFKG